MPRIGSEFSDKNWFVAPDKIWLGTPDANTNAADYVKGADGIHFKFRTTAEGKKIMQIIIGEAKIKNELKDGINSAFESIGDYLSHNIQDRNLLDRHLMDQIVDEEEAAEIKDYILSIPRKTRETVFGIFIGYSIKYNGADDTIDEYEQHAIQENIKQVLLLKDHIIAKINAFKVSNYEFNFYFLPFHDAARDRQIIMKSLTEGKPHLAWGNIRNG